jgi:hypothetical protein
MPDTSVTKKHGKVAVIAQPTVMTSRAGVVYSVDAVGPAIAEKWLAKNSDNRRVRKATIERYARDMASGEWVENGAAISFAEDGTLLDGQHRLWAVVESGATIQTLVARNLPARVQDTMDDGTKRTLGDTFNFHRVENSNTAAAIVRRVILWQQGYRTNQGTYQPTKAESLAALNDDPTISTAIEQACALSRRRLTSPSLIGLTWWLFWDIDEQACSDFWNGLHTGVGLDETSPIYIVREQIMRQNARSERIPETAYLAWIIKAWNHWRADKQLSPAYRYTFTSSEKFPEPR